MKPIYIGLAALALLAGPACAQSVTSESTTTTTAPLVGSSTTTTKKAVDSSGTEIEAKQSTKHGPGGSVSQSETSVKRPDGSIEKETRDQRSTTPNVGSSTTSTTIRR